MGASKKISDEQFLSILRENGGLFARTAREIKKHFGIEYSRQAVRDRADKHPDEYLDILEENLDIAEEGLMSLIRSKNENIRLRACELVLKTKGKKRGYIERTELSGADGKDLIPPRTLSREEAAEMLRELDNGKFPKI